MKTLTYYPELLVDQLRAFREDWPPPPPQFQEVVSVRFVHRFNRTLGPIPPICQPRRFFSESPLWNWPMLQVASDLGIGVRDIAAHCFQ